MKYLNEGGDIENNEEVMDEIMDELKEENIYFDSEKQLKSHLKKQRKSKKMEVE